MWRNKSITLSICRIFSRGCFLVGSQEVNGEMGFKTQNTKKEVYCSGNSVFKCLSQILKELFVIEQTCWMQTLVDLSAGCIKILWRCVTVVNRCELYVLTSFGGSSFYTKTFSGFLHVGNKWCFNIQVFTLRAYPIHLLIVIFAFAPVKGSSTIQSEICLLSHYRLSAHQLGRRVQSVLKKEGLKKKHVM